MSERKKIKVKKINGEYNTVPNVLITTAQWEDMLQNKDIFRKESLELVKIWYEQIGYQSNHVEIFSKYSQYNNSGPLNLAVGRLGKRIINYLNTFEIIREDGESFYWILPFKGWYEYDSNNRHFVWQLREELIQAIENLNLFKEIDLSYDNDLISVTHIKGQNEGKKTQYYTTRYERNAKNRKKAIKSQGAFCHCCDFDFEKVYGELGEGFIEVHHLIPLSSLEEEVIIKPETDLICVCSNCHRMIHRRKNEVITPDELKEIIRQNK
jgi:5-methylcytosine-specific restriction protein A